MAHSEKTVYPRIGEEVIWTTLDNGLPVCVVPKKDYDRAVEEITRQLTAVQNGDWEDWEQQGALQAMLSSLTSLPDSQSALENYYLGQIATDCDETPEQLARALREVTKERIMAAAQSARLDTVYFLHGKEEA